VSTAQLVIRAGVGVARGPGVVHGEPANEGRTPIDFIASVPRLGWTMSRVYCRCGRSAPSAACRLLPLKTIDPVILHDGISTGRSVTQRPDGLCP
jgi:hypothetical protein